MLVANHLQCHLHVAGLGHQKVAVALHLAMRFADTLNVSPVVMVQVVGEGCRNQQS